MSEFTQQVFNQSVTEHFENFSEQTADCCDAAKARKEHVKSVAKLIHYQNTPKNET